MTDQPENDYDATIDTMLSEHAAAGRRLRWVVVTDDGWGVIDDPRNSEHGPVNDLLMVQVPDGVHYFAMPDGEGGGINWSVEGTCLLIRRLPVDREQADQDLLVTYGPAGWHNVRSLANLKAG